MQTTDTRKFSLVYAVRDDYLYEVHDFNCKAKTRYLQDRRDIETIRGSDVHDALVDVKATLAADWGGEPADSNFHIHKCAN
jgi:hypothetical protein